MDFVGIMPNIPCFVATGIRFIATLPTVAPFVNKTLFEGITQAELCFNPASEINDFVESMYLCSVSSILTNGIEPFS